MLYINAKYLFFKGVDFTIGHECRDTAHYSIDFTDTFRIFFICGDSSYDGQPDAYPCLADEGNKKAKTVMHITDDTSKMLSAILIGNNVVNLSAASLTTTLAYNLGGSMVAVASAVLSVLIIIFGEITPRRWLHCMQRRCLFVMLRSSICTSRS